MRRVLGRTLMVLSLAAVAAVPSVLSAQRSRPTPAAAPAAAAPRPIRFGTAVSGTLQASDPRLTGRGAFHTYGFTARADKRYVIAMEGRGFNSTVFVMRPVGGITEIVAAEFGARDDSDVSKARLRFRTETPGPYVIVAHSDNDEEFGTYSLLVEELEPAVPPAPRPIAVGQRVEGQITDGSAIDDAEGYPYDVYTITGNGQRVNITLRSADFDAFLLVRPPAVPDGDEMLSDDDGGAGVNGTDARVTVTLDGTYIIYARPLGNGERGSYTLSVEEAVAPVVQQRPVAIGEEMRGELTGDDPELDEGGFFQEYVLDAAAGDEFRITLRSTEFDAYLRWGTKTGAVFTTLDEDDDSGGDLDSQLVVRATTAGRYVIRVSALEPGTVGPYTLQVVRMQR